MTAGHTALRRKIVVGLALTATIAGASAAEPRLADPPLARRLGDRVSISWSGQSLTAGLRRLAEVHQFPLWIDRRVDPHFAVDFEIANATLAEALDRLAAASEERWGWSTLADVVYFGPRHAARDLATAATLARMQVRLGETLRDQQRQWLAPRVWEFPRRSEPRELLTAICAAHAVELANPARIPHDVWPAASLPRIAPVDQAVLILLSFDLWAGPTPGNAQWRVVPLPHPLQMVAQHPRTPATEAAAAAIAAADPEVRVRRAGRRLDVSGRWEDHQRIRAAIRGDAAADGARDDQQPAAGDGAAAQQLDARQRYTMRIENQPARRVMEQLAGKLGLTLAWEGAAAPRSDSLISCDVRDAPLDELLTAILTPAGLEFTRDGTAISIHAAP